MRVLKGRACEVGVRVRVGSWELAVTVVVEVGVLAGVVGEVAGEWWKCQYWQRVTVSTVVVLVAVTYCTVHPYKL
jgi:hypothetical protein